MQRLLDSWHTTFAKLGLRKPSSRRRPASRRLNGTYARRHRFEPLEDRRVLAAVTVSNDLDLVNGTTTSIANLIANDGGDGISLREALIAANADAAADTIAFGLGPGTHTITLTQGQLEIQNDLTIIGPGSEFLTIDAVGNDMTPGSDPLDGNIYDDGKGSRIFDIPLGGSVLNVSLSGLRLTGGDVEGTGGAIQSYGNNLSLSGLEIIGNYAHTSTPSLQPAGGGAYIVGIGSNVITIDDTIFADNVGGGKSPINTDGDTNSSGHGGGLYLDMQGGDEVTITESQFLDNTSGDWGGGLFVRNGSQAFGNPGEFTLQDSVVSGNQAGFKYVYVTADKHSAAYGGGIYLQSVSTGDQVGSAKFIRNDVSHNTATVRGGGMDVVLIEGYGGGSTTPPLTVEIRDSTIHDNVAYGDATYALSIGQKPGGGGIRISVSGSSETVVTNTTISHNRALNGAGMMLSSNDGISSNPSSIQIQHSTITGNIAGPFTDANPDYPDAVGDSLNQQVTSAGGVHIRLYAGNYGNAPPTVNFDHTIIAGNEHHQDGGSPSLEYSPDLGSDVEPGAQVELPVEEPFYTFDASYSLIGYLGPHFYFNLLDLDYDPNTSIVGGTTSEDPAVDPLLGPLTYNGGPELPGGFTLLTHLPESGSPAIDAGDPMFESPPATDERGFNRVADGDDVEGAIIDIGAVEVNGGPAPDPECSILGDYNRNAAVDAADYTVWRDAVTAGLSTLFNRNPDYTGPVDEFDFLFWRDHFGETCETAGQGAQSLAVTVADYNADGIVDLDDYDIWFDNFGSTTELAADGNGNGVVDLADLALWQDYNHVTTLDEDIVGDFNLDGVVDSADYQIYVETHGSTTDLRADADDDGIVDEDDLALMEDHFGTTSAALLPYIRNATQGTPLEIVGEAPNVVGVRLGGSGSTHADYDFAGVVGSGLQLRAYPITLGIAP